MTEKVLSLEFDSLEGYNIAIDEFLFASNYDGHPLEMIKEDTGNNLFLANRLKNPQSSEINLNYNIPDYLGLTPQQEKAVCMAAEELLLNITHGLTDGYVTQTDGDPSNKEAVLRQAFIEIKLRNLPPPILQIVYDDEQNIGYIEVSHPIIEGFSPPFSQETVLERRQKNTGMIPLGGITDIEQGLISKIFQESGLKVGQVKITDKLGIRFMRVMFGE